MHFVQTVVSAALMAGAVSVASVATAQVPLGGMIMGDDFDRISELAGAYGPVELQSDGARRWIEGDLDGTIYSISFLNCDDQERDCSTVQFRAWWESDGHHSIDSMNHWNRDRRFSAAYLDADSNATIEFDVNLAGGVTAVNFDDTLQWWQAVLGQFRDEVIDPGYEGQEFIGTDAASDMPTAVK